MIQPLHPAFSGKAILITGVTGTVGRELLRQLVRFAEIRVVGIDNNESEIFYLEEAHRDDPVELFLADIRDRDALTQRFRGVDVVFHCAAMKHVGVCERSPRDVLQCNLIGTQNVIDASVANDVEQVCLTSSDKAVNPTNVMGSSKLMCERLMTAANLYTRSNGCRFSSTRFGNVLGSRGSVIPLFRRQIEAGGPVTITDRRMTRFIMGLRQSVRLVLESAPLAEGGEIFVPRMPVAAIEDLAHVMIQAVAPRVGRDPASIQILELGARPGEKLYEELLTEEESRRAYDIGEYIAIPPTSRRNGHPPIARAYNSRLETPLSRTRLRDFLIEHGLLEREIPVSEESVRLPLPVMER